MSLSRWVRPGFVSAASLAGALSLVMTVRRDWWIVSPAVALMVAAALLAHFAAFSAQLLARAVWWSNLALGLVISLIGSDVERPWGTLMALTCGLALLAADRRRLAIAGERAAYAPAAFRSWLLLLMVLALADAQTFILFAFVEGHDYSRAATRVAKFLPLLAVGVTYLVGFAGLYRLRVWGAILNFGVSLASAAFILAGALTVPGKLRGFLLVITLAHVVVVAPMLITLALGARPPEVPPRVKSLAPVGVIVGIMLLAVASFVTQQRGLI